jgi:hypothetical protein
MKKDFFYRLNNAVHLLWAGATAGLYCTAGYALISALDRGVNRLFVFGLGGGGVSL